MDTTLELWLADRPLLWVFRALVDVLLRSAAAIPGRGALMAAAMLLEGLQAFTPDRHADFYAALISASGAMAAILPADFLIPAPRLALVRLARMRLLRDSRRTVAPESAGALSPS